MAQAEESLKRLTDFLARLVQAPEGEPHPGVQARLAEARTAFHDHISADLNTAAALGILFDLVRALNTAFDAGELTAADAPAVRDTFERFDKVLGILSLRRLEEDHPPVPIEEIEALIEARRAARRGRNFAEADRIRAELDGRGIILEDTGTATRWKRK
jgi:cysteinyl-tRNA synthetase